MPDGAGNGWQEYLYEAVPANYTVTCSVGNSHAEYDFEMNLQMILRFLDVLVEFSDTLFGQTTTFTQTFTNASHLKCDRDLGDGTITSTEDFEPTTPITLDHDYTSEGAYLVNWTCYNDLGEVYTNNQYIYIETAITDLALTEEEFNVVFGDDVSLSFSMSAGTAVVIVITDDNTDTPDGDIVKYHNDGNLAGTALIRSPSVGFHRIVINASNHLSNDHVVALLRVDIPMEGLTVVPDKFYTEPNVQVYFDVSTLEGSFGLYYTDFQDLYSHIFHTASVGGPVSYTTNHSWADIGYYGVSFNVSNNLTTTLYDQLEIGIEIALGTLSIESTGLPELLSIFDISVPVEFTVSQTGGLQATSVRAEIDVNSDGIIEFTEDITINDATDYEAVQEFADFGLHTTNVTLYNNVSSVTLLTLVQVGVNISGGTFSLITNPAKVGEGVSFNCHVDKGSALLYNVSFGNGQWGTAERTTAAIPTDWLNADDTVITHVYSSTGFYDASLTISNAQGEVVLALDQQVVVHSNVTGLVASPDKWAAAVGEDVTISTSILQGTDAFFHLAYGDGAEADWEFHPDFNSAASSVNFTHAFISAGNFTPILTVNNSVNVENITLGPLVIQNPVVTLTASDDSPVPSPPGIATYTVTTPETPTDAFCDYDFGESIEGHLSYAPDLSINQPHVDSKTFAADVGGTFTVTINCSNFVSSAVATVETTVQREIEDPQVVLAGPFGETGVEVFFNVSVAFGSHLYFDCSYGDGGEFVDVAADDTSSTTQLFSHVYSSSGNYTIDCTVSNEISSIDVSNQNPLVIQNGVPDDLQVVPNKAVFLRDESIVYTVSTTTSPYPNEVFIEWDVYGDGLVVQDVFTPALSTVGEATFSYASPSGLHPFGYITTKVNCSNRVSYVTKTVGFHVQTLITDLSISTVSMVTPPFFELSVDVVFTVRMSTGYNVSLTLNYGDRDPPELVTRVIEGDVTDVLTDFVWSYDAVSNYTVEVTGNNLASGDVTTAIDDLIIQKGIIDSEIDLSLANNALFVDYMSGAATFVLSKPDDVEIAPTDVHVAADFGDQTALHYSYVSQWPFTINHGYTSDYVGDVTATFTFSNLVSEDATKTFTFAVVEAIEGLVIEQDDQIAAPGEQYHFGISVTYGSHIILVIDYGDGNSAEIGYDDVRQKQFSLSYIYSEAKEYVITVSAENAVGMETAVSEVIKMTNGVSGMVLSFRNTNVALPYGELHYAVVANPNGAIPTSPDVTVQAGDNTLPIVFESVDFSQSFEQVLVYTTPGTYLLMVNVTNAGGSQSLTAQVDVFEVIDGLDFTFKSKESGDIQEAYAIGEELEFTRTLERGTGVEFAWEFVSGGGMVNSETPSETYAFSVPGTHEVVLIASNPVGFVSVVHSVKITALIAVESFELTREITYLEATNFTMTLKEVSKICYTYTLIDENGVVYDKFWRANDEKLCRQETPESNKLTIIPEQTVDFFWYPALTGGKQVPFTDVGVYLVIVLVEAHGGTLEFTDELVVKTIPCDPPKVLYLSRNPGQTPDNRRVYTRSEVLKFSSSTDFEIQRRCELTTGMDPAKWTVFLSDSSGQRGLPYSEKALGMVNYVGAVEIPQRTLNLGYYEMLFEIGMNSSVVEGKVGNISVFFEVKGSPLVVDLSFGETRKVGYKTILLIDGIFLTYDPDADRDDKSAMVFTWYCWRDTIEEGTTIENGKLTGDLPAIEVPTNGKNHEIGTLVYIHIIMCKIGKINMNDAKVCITRAFKFNFHSCIYIYICNRLF